MKNLYVCFFAILAMVSCREKSQNEELPAENTDQLEEMVYQSFGEKITTDQATSVAQLEEKYLAMSTNDTITTKFKASIGDVCAAKGCWVKIDMPGSEQQAFVKFKDNGFFVPTDSKGDAIVLNGKAFIEEMSVDEQRHYAEDAGASQEEIAAITEPKRTYRFLADGALVADTAQ